MQETIAQALGLAMHGNAFLRGMDIGAFWPEATFFGYCRSVRFVAADDALVGGPERLVADDPRAWLRSLQTRCHGLRVRVARRGPAEVGDRMTVGFVDGGSRWLIEEIGGVRPLSWSGDWSFADRSVQDGQIWSVTYCAVPAGSASEEPPRLDVVEQDLRGSLQAIARFADGIGSHFADSFRKALACLDGEACESHYHPDLAPPGLLSRQAERILAACDAGWVFGGMGSWNDGAYAGEDADVGDPLSQGLFDGLQAALAGVAGSTAPTAAGAFTRP
jgi:hypothetical protein